MIYQVIQTVTYLNGNLKETNLKRKSLKRDTELFKW